MLTPKKRRFINEYLIDLNAAQAAIRTGYSKRTARAAGARLLTDVDVAAGIKAAQAALAERTAITQDKVIRELAKIGFSDCRKLYDQFGNLKPIHELDDDAAAALAGIETEQKASRETDDDESDQVILTTVRKVKRWDKVRALELLGKQLGMFVEHVEHSGNLTCVFRDPTERPPQMNGYHRKPALHDGD